MNKKDRTKPKSFRIPKELSEKIDLLADQKGYLNPSEYIRSIVRNEIEKEEVQ